MAVSSTFKQKCPSCETMVTIKDGSLIGKKVECPKCKDRFIVESPVDTDKAAVKGKKDANGANGSKANGAKARRFRDDEEELEEGNGKKGAATKKAPPKGAAKKRTDDDDEEDDDEE